MAWLAVPTALEIAEKVALIAAVTVAGAWVYFNTFRGRTYHPRLQLRLTVERRRAGNVRLL